MSSASERNGGAKRLNDAVLNLGDIVLTTTTAAVSKAIRVATRCDISHVMVYVENCSVIDSTGEGVHARNTQRIFFEEECSIHLLRLRSGISVAELSSVITYMRGHIGTQYSTREAVLAALGGARQWTAKQFCSRLVAQAFASAGIHLVGDPNFCSPADIKASSLLVAVPDATKSVTAEEMAASIQDISNQINKSTSITRDAVQKATDADSSAKGMKVVSESIGEVTELIQAIASQINGRITAVTPAAKLGAYVSPETELFRIADPSKIP